MDLRRGTSGQSEKVERRSWRIDHWKDRRKHEQERVESRGHSIPFLRVGNPVGPVRTSAHGAAALRRRMPLPSSARLLRSGTAP